MNIERLGNPLDTENMKRALEKVKEYASFFARNFIQKIEIFSSFEKSENDGDEFNGLKSLIV